MNLEKKKLLAQRTLKIGKKRILFLKSRLDEIKEAITKQDIKNLQESGAIIIKNIKGRKRNLKKKIKKSAGNIRKKVNRRKKEYMIMARKLRRYLAEMKKQGKVTNEEIIEIRKKIRNRYFKSKNYLKAYIKNLERWKQ